MVFTDCESCARPIPTNQGSIEAGEYRLTRETSFVARRLVVVAVARLLWISWCVLGAAGFRVFFPRFIFLRTHTACCKYEAPCLIYLSPSIKKRQLFASWAKTHLHPGVRTGYHI